MDLKSTLRAIALELRRELEGKYDAQGNWQPGDLERRLAAIGVRRDRSPVPVDELPHLSADDHEARRVVDAFLQSRAEAGQGREAAMAEFVRGAAYSWANRLLALRCMEARALIDEVILQKDAYGGRSLQHNRLAKKEPERCAGEDEGLLAVLFDEFLRRAEELPLLFDPRAPEVALRPSVAALKRCVALLSGTVPAKGQETATDEVFTAPDALGWTYQYWNTEEKDRVFEKVRTKKGAKIEGAEIIPATCIYTEPYMVKFLVQNSLGAMWMGMNPGSRVYEGWEYYVRDADRAPASKKAVSEITFLDPACGSGHFLIEAFELFYSMYLEEGAITDPAKICAAIFERNLYGIDIDERAVLIAALALVMKAKQKAPDFVPRQVNLVATNIALPTHKDRLDSFLGKHPEDTPLKPALLVIFEGLAHADEVGSLLQIEEPVDKELRHLRDQQGPQFTFDRPTRAADWEAWKRDTLDRLRQHFVAEGKVPDLASRFLGEAAGKGLSLVELLSRRYDVVAANPPYMGSKNMGAVLKRHVDRHFAAGKRDLYAAFILGCLRLVNDGGRVAMVTQQSWMFLRSFADLRALDDAKQRKAPKAFGGILRETVIEALVHLGPRAFSEVGGEVVNTVLFVLSRAKPGAQHRLSAFRLVGPKNPEAKDSLLREAASALTRHKASFCPLQLEFLVIPYAPLPYWLSDWMLRLFRDRPPVAKAGYMGWGISSSNNDRFLRRWWEVSSRSRWLPHAKGGTYGRWTGLVGHVVDWDGDGVKLKEFIVERYPYLGRNYEIKIRPYTFHSFGWTYSSMAGGCLGVRLLMPDHTTNAKSPALFTDNCRYHLGAVLNSRLASYLLRAIAPALNIDEGYVGAIPSPAIERQEILDGLVQDCLALKRALLEGDPTERGFSRVVKAGASLRDCYRREAEQSEAAAAILHALEAIGEGEVVSAYGVGDDDLASVLDETGKPAGWFPLLSGYNALPPVTDGLSLSSAPFTSLSRASLRVLSAEEVLELKRRLRWRYGRGPGARTDYDNAEASFDTDEDENDDSSVSAAHIPIPAETFIEELAQELEIHPIAVYWLVCELREQEGLVCAPGLRQFVEDYMSVVVLRLLGHRWPREIESHEPVPSWADRDGIIEITADTDQATLLDRIRDRFAEAFGAERAGAIQREFEDIVGSPLDVWLASEFFKRHVSQFKKRPLAWQVESTPNGKRKRQERRSARRVPAFSCLVYYHRLDGDLLPKLRTQYLGPLRTSLQTELGGLERLMTRTADQDSRRFELEEKIEELTGFDARLEQVIAGGWASTALDALASKEPLDKWTSRTGRAPVPSSRDAFLAQERKYDPDINDGVRVNIAPLQRAGVLAADVLVHKDVEKAITDRAEWRADERRWCREGKLTRPGWWSGGDGEA